MQYLLPYAVFLEEQTTAEHPRVWTIDPNKATKSSAEHNKRGAFYYIVCEAFDGDVTVACTVQSVMQHASAPALLVQDIERSSGNWC